MAKTKKETKELLEQVPDFTDLFERKTAEQVQSMLDEFLLGEEDAESSSKESTRYEKKSEETNSVDKAFADFLG